MYSCGPTVYGPSHIGNFRSFLFADLLHRYLVWSGYKVTWVMNVTDVDDRIIKNLMAAGGTLDELTAPHIARFQADLETLRISPRDVMPRATQHVPEMAALIARLIDERSRLSHRRRLDLLPHLLMAGLWRAGQAPARTAAPGRARCRGRLCQGRRARLCPVERPTRRRAELVDRDRRWPAGLAHRVLCDEHEVPRSDIRHPHAAAST